MSSENLPLAPGSDPAPVDADASSLLTDISHPSYGAGRSPTASPAAAHGGRQARFGMSSFAVASPPYGKQDKSERSAPTNSNRYAFSPTNASSSSKSFSSSSAAAVVATPAHPDSALTLTTPTRPTAAAATGAGDGAGALAGAPAAAAAAAAARDDSLLLSPGTLALFTPSTDLYPWQAIMLQGLCGCCDEPGTFCCSLFCRPCVAGQNFRAVRLICIVLVSLLFSFLDCSVLPTFSLFPFFFPCCPANRVGWQRVLPRRLPPLSLPLHDSPRRDPASPGRPHLFLLLLLLPPPLVRPLRSRPRGTRTRLVAGGGAATVAAAALGGS